MYERPGRPAGPSRCARVAEAAPREREAEADHKTRGGGAPEQLKQHVRFDETGQNHVPRGSGSHPPPAARRDTHRAVYEHIAGADMRPCLLCGDLNTRAVSSGRDHLDLCARPVGRLRPDRGREWDAAELLLIRDLERYGFRDAFRARHGYGKREISWGWQRWEGGYRLDHLLVSGLAIEECRYEHSCREQGLSDHSPLIARLRSDGRGT